MISRRNSRTGTERSPLADLAATVRSRRAEAGLTQRDLAALANTGPRFIVDLERAKATLEIGKVAAVLEALGLELRVEPIRPLQPRQGERP